MPGMPATSASSDASRAIPVVRLAELPALAEKLAACARAGEFAPDVIVYVETGARLLAHALGERMAVPVVPVWVQRGGHGLKQKLAPLAARLPVALRDALRRAEEISGVHRLTRRKTAMRAKESLVGKRVLLVDDASDTGRTLAAARGLVLASGVAAADVRSAVLAATTPRGQAVVDFFLFDRNCRMPWSADSDERVAAEARAAQLAPADAPRPV